MQKVSHIKDHVRSISFGRLRLRLGLDGQLCGKDEVVVTVIKLIFQSFCAYLKQTRF